MDSQLRDLSRRLSLTRGLVVAMALALALGVGFTLRGLVFAQDGQQRDGQQQQAQLPAPSDLSRAFINVAKQVEPAVVNIDIEETPKEQSALPRGLHQFQIPGFPQGRPQPERGTGSGIIISPDGYILTNNHVAGEADKMKVTLGDGREFKATRVGTDPDTDLAVIKIDAHGDRLPYAKLGNSDDVQQGEWVVALGSPFGLQQTMTAGIVSAVGRNLKDGKLVDYIQTDASINPGNSGGPLVNMSGQVVGINTMIVSSSGGSQGVGFSIPSNVVNKVYAELIKSGKVTRGYLGVVLQDMTAAQAKNVGYDQKGGALVADLAKDPSAPAARAGLASGDVIVEFDGKPVTSRSQLTNIVADEPVGKTVQVKYFRDGKIETTTLKTAERPSTDEVAKNRDGDGDEGSNTGKLGVGVETVDPRIIAQNNLKLRINTGAFVTRVDPGSPAEEAGIQVGDVIHRINTTRVNTAADLTRAMRSLSNQDQIMLQVEHDGQLGFATVELD
jgi:serine protease Do